MSRFKWMLGGSLVIGAGAAFTMPMEISRPVPRLTVRAGSIPPESSIAAGGMTPPIEVEFSPKAISTKSGQPGEKIIFDLAVTHDLGTEANVVYGFDVIDDRGNNVVPFTKGTPVKVNGKSKKNFDVIVDPIAIDGFYIVRASVGGKGTSGPGFETVAESYWQVQNGKVIQLDYSEFFASSRISTAVNL